MASNPIGMASNLIEMANLVGIASNLRVIFLSLKPDFLSLVTDDLMPPHAPFCHPMLQNSLKSSWKRETTCWYSENGHPRTMSLVLP